MSGKLKRFRTYSGSLVAAALVIGLVPGVASAQVDARFEAIESRIDSLDRIESQIRALQRVVFPGGDERFFEPEITAETSSPVEVNTPSASALTNVLTRLDAIEAQLARLTAATEVNENSLRMLEMRVAAAEIAAQQATQPSGVIEMDEPAVVEAAAVPEATLELPPMAEEGPTEERLTGVQAITKPASGDEGDDEYVYGFRLWNAGYFSEAQQQLTMFVEQYPDHWRTTYGRNLLGRAYLDDGEPRRAATHFFENYQADKDAARAPDSLLFLVESMTALGDTGRACIALAEFGDTYPALATGRLQGQYESNRGRVDCE